MWPNPPRPMTPTRCPATTFQCCIGENVVIPAQSSGAVAARSTPGWDADDEALGHDQLIGVAAEGVATRLIGRVVGKGGPLDAVLFAISQTVLAGPAGVDHAAHAADVTDPELGHRASHGLHATDDLVARDARISSPVPRRPFIARLMDVGMADAAIQHVEQDVVGS